MDTRTKELADQLRYLKDLLPIVLGEKKYHKADMVRHNINVVKKELKARTK